MYPNTAGVAPTIRGASDAGRRADGGRGLGQGSALLGAFRDNAADCTIAHAGVGVLGWLI